MTAVPGRPGWEFGMLILEMESTRRAVWPPPHEEIALWAFGQTEEEILTAAHDVIDEFIMKRVFRFSELIETDDQEGGAVRIVAR